MTRQYFESKLKEAIFDYATGKTTMAQFFDNEDGLREKVWRDAVDTTMHMDDIHRVIQEIGTAVHIDDDSIDILSGSTFRPSQWKDNIKEYAEAGYSIGVMELWYELKVRTKLVLDEAALSDKDLEGIPTPREWHMRKSNPFGYTQHTGQSDSQQAGATFYYYRAIGSEEDYVNAIVIEFHDLGIFASYVYEDLTIRPTIIKDSYMLLGSLVSETIIPRIMKYDLPHIEVIFEVQSDTNLEFQTEPSEEFKHALYNQSKKLIEKEKGIPYEQLGDVLITVHLRQAIVMLKFNNSTIE